MTLMSRDLNNLEWPLLGLILKEHRISASINQSGEKMEKDIFLKNISQITILTIGLEEKISAKLI